jgi:hypothetical protein
LRFTSDAVVHFSCVKDSDEDLGNIGYQRETTMNNVWQSIAGFPLRLLYFATVMALLVLFVAIYVRVMPYHEESGSEQF